jgi:hypothetical protein
MRVAFWTTSQRAPQYWSPLFQPDFNRLYQQKKRAHAVALWWEILDTLEAWE